MLLVSYRASFLSLKHWIRFVNCCDFKQQLRIGWRTKWGTLIEKIEDTLRILIEKIDDSLIIGELNTPCLSIRETLSYEFLFFGFEDILHVQLLEFLICVIDAQLFEAVHEEYFETEDIKQTDRWEFF